MSNQRGAAESAEYAADDGIATIEISGPDRNLLNPENMAGLEASLTAACADERVTGILLTGSGSVFCGGLDTAAFARGGDPREFAGALVSLLKLLPTLPKPVAAAVNGDAVASGSAIVAACDFAVAGPDTRIGTLEAGIGVWPMVAQVPIIQRVGPRAAIENIASGEPFTAARAREIGLINVVTDPADVRAEATAWLRKAARAGAVMATGRPFVYELAELDYDEALDTALARFTSVFGDRP
ncbi:enoyl-CoA hydratase/isomerase family protein [Cryobacterium sp. BB736]|uniref:enoyl-CoA hydratase/isomerase family protein n=1 Tax=Cryobacterium sp. BB736 TaxID=2746963 RepID=UPI001873983D